MKRHDVTERPILFNGQMVPPVLADIKTQTRRVVKPQPYSVSLVPSGNHLFDYRTDLSDYSRVVDMNKAVTLCPYGQIGHKLWVKESFSGPHCVEKQGGFPALPPSQWHPESEIWYWADGNPQHGDWTRPRPSIHMPRWASRITLEITDVRVERLQDISRGDAMAEGCPFPNMAAGPDPRQWYAELWNQINGPSSWDFNPWVWCVTFKRIKP